MSRALTPSVVAQTKATQVQPAFLFEGEFSGQAIRTWSGVGELNWDGRVWDGFGALMGISNIGEDNEISAKGITVTLTGVPSEIISLALQDCRQGSAGIVYLGFISGNQIINDPVLMFQGRLDVVEINEDDETSSISLNYESRLIDLQRSKVSRFTDEDQRREFPGDFGCAFVVSLQDKNIRWGGA
jgi:hypothetical protein